MQTQYPINRREVYRYLGLRGAEPEEQMQVLIEECIRELYRVAQPRYLYQIYPLEITEDSLNLGLLETDSKNLQKNLQGCEQVAVMAATLGADVDRLMHRYEVTAVTKSVILQAAAAALIESVCDVCQEEIRQAAEADGYFLRPRFSPGYGDFAIENQRAVIDGLMTAKRIGLSLVDSYMMVPTKSVTAVIGFSREYTACHREGCESCQLQSCQYRR